MIDMKHFTKSLGATLLTLFTSAAIAQNNPIESYRFNPDFTPKDSSYYTYTSQDKLKEKTTVAYDANAQTWANSSKETYLLDGQGIVLSKLTFTWENNAWAESLKTTNTHTNNKLMVSITENKTSNGWEKLQQLEYTYTQDGKIDSLYTYKFDDVGLKEKSTRTKYHYTTGGALAERVIERWISSSSTWDVRAKWVYLYDFNDRLLKEEEDNFIGGQWHHIHHYKYNYSNDDKLRIKEHKNSASGQAIESEGFKYVGETTYLSVKAVANNVTVKAYPNPSSSNVVLSWDAEGMYSVTITDISGKVVQSLEKTTNNKVNIDGTALKQGVYFYTLKNTETSSQTIGRFMITR
jgi:hypothetical protein